MKTHCSVIEPLEPRIAPATLLNPKTVQYTDPDGDTVLVKTSHGSWDLANDFVFGSSAAGGESLLKMNLTGKPKFLGANISVMASGPGDGLAAVGFIDATDLNLGSVVVDGDLGRISVGNALTNTPALHSLKADSMGIYGLATQGGSGSLSSSFNGAVGSIKILHDVKEASLSTGSLMKIEIGGDLIGTATGFSGSISSEHKLGTAIIHGDVTGAGGFSGEITGGDIGSVTIDGNLYGGTMQDSGAILAGNHLGTVLIKGSVFGDKGQGSGSIRSGAGGIGSVQIGKSLFGGDGPSAGEIYSSGSIGQVQTGVVDPTNSSIYGSGGAASGYIFAVKNIGKILIPGNLYGGRDHDSGEIYAGGNIAQVHVKGSVYGGSAFDTGAIQSKNGHVGKVVIDGSFYGGTVTGSQSAGETGYISGQIIGSVFIGGTLYAGTDSSSGTLSDAGAIRSAHSIGNITVGGDIFGSSAVRVIISAVGTAQQSTQHDLAIGSIHVGGAMKNVDVLAGFDLNTNPVNVDAQIGSIHITKDLIATNLVAGVTSGAGDAYFGDTNDQRITDSTDRPFPSKLRTVIIGGVVDGSSDSSTDHFGFVADQIGLLKINGAAVALTPGPINDTVPQQIAATTADVFLREV